MRPPVQNLYASSAMRALSRAEAALARSKARTRPGTCGLRLCMTGDSQLPLRDEPVNWVCLHADGKRWHGNVQARMDESLPFADDAFELVLISHAHQHAPDCAELLREAVRVLAPEGVLLLNGVHPVSAWAPWVWWQLRTEPQPLHLRSPFQWGQTLASCGAQVQGVRRFGATLPHARCTDAAGSAWSGGGCMLVASKQRLAVTPLRISRDRKQARMPGALAPGAHRECA